LSKLFNKLFVCPQWFIAYRIRKTFSCPFDTLGFRIIKPPPGQFYADPFPIKVNDKNYIFFETFSHIKRKGFISCIEIRPNGTATKPYVVLERPYHLSYPFLFMWNQQIYMIPETADNETIELYVAKKFPCEWSLEKVLIQGIRASDTTVWFTENKVWLFTNLEERGKSPYSQLYLYYADSIVDEWRAHPLNPVVNDIRSARPAGNLFFYQGDLIRPSQNSFIRYGGSLVFNKLTCLTELDYQEEKIDEINPSWYPKNQSCHTYNFSEDLEVIDGEIVTYEFLKPLRRVLAYFRS